MDFLFQPVDSLEAVPAQFRPLYTSEAKDGKFAPLESHKGVIEAITGLNTALKAERNNKKKAVDLAPLAEFGDSVEAIHTTVTTKLKEMSEQVAQGGKVNVEKIKAEIAQQYTGELTKAKTRGDALQKQLYKLLVENSATAAVMEHKGMAELMLPFITSQVQVKEENGEFSVFVVDQTGDRRYSTVTGQPMTIKDLVAEMKGQPKYGPLFESAAPDGGGMTPGSGKTSPVKKVKTENLSPNERIAVGLRNRGRVHGAKSPPGMT
jgi:hypothetical protein